MRVYEHRVRFNEVDAQGIVFNAHYLTWCDHAISEYFRKNNWSFIDLKELGFNIVVRKVQLEYEASALLDDLVTFDVDIKRVGHSSMDVVYDLKVQEELKVHVEITYVNVLKNQACDIPLRVREYVSSIS